MIRLTALSSLRIAPDDLTRMVRATLGQPMRREGTQARLCAGGIVSCLGHADPARNLGRTALIWGSVGSTRVDVDMMLDEICRNDGLPMPFDFIASQCVVAAVYAARYIADLRCGIYLASSGNIWEQMLSLAACWLEEGRYDQVLCGWVDQARPDAVSQFHVSDWLLLAGSAGEPVALADVRLNRTAAQPVGIMPDCEFIPALKQWLDTGAPHAFAESAICPIEFNAIAPEPAAEFNN